MSLKFRFFQLPSRLIILISKSKWKYLIRIITSINTQLISFLALSKHFKFTALFDHCNISRKHYYIDFKNEPEEGQFQWLVHS